MFHRDSFGIRLTHTAIKAFSSVSNFKQMDASSHSFLSYCISVFVYLDLGSIRDLCTIAYDAFSVMIADIHHFSFISMNRLVLFSTSDNQDHETSSASVW